MTDTPILHSVQDKLDLRTSEGVAIVNSRESVYGEVTENMCRVALVWSGILGHEVKPTDVPLMMIGLKAVRTQVTPDYSDNSDDIEGFLEMFRRVVGPDMVKARSVDEYVLLRGVRS